MELTHIEINTSFGFVKNYFVANLLFIFNEKETERKCL